MKLIRRLMKDRRGSVAVEFVVVLPVLLLLLFGIIEMGTAWYYRQMMVNASREGARMGALTATGAATETVTGHVNNVLTNAGFPAAFTVSASGVGGSTGDLVTVQVDSTYAFPVLSALVPAVGTVNLQAVTVMRHE